MARAGAPAKQSDLAVRVLSAVIMVAVAGTVLWFGGWPLQVMVMLIAVGLAREWSQLVTRFGLPMGARLAWMAGGGVYIGAACTSILIMPAELRWLVIVAVIATDTGAYFTGRHFGGRKIAPAISPSKTWAGLYGGMASAALVLGGAWLVIASTLAALNGSYAPSWVEIIRTHPLALASALIAGALLAILAQAGDFFESWMKRRAQVKDSGALIPGHGGLFDRLDGLLPVAIAAGLFLWIKTI